MCADTDFGCPDMACKIDVSGIWSGHVFWLSGHSRIIHSSDYNVNTEWANLKLTFLLQLMQYSRSTSQINFLTNLATIVVKTHKRQYYIRLFNLEKLSVEFSSTQQFFFSFFFCSPFSPLKWIWNGFNNNNNNNNNNEVERDLDKGMRVVFRR